jgi:hypothetical protein
MVKKVEEFLANLLRMGFKREVVLEKGYEYALALQAEQLPAGSSTPAYMMADAVTVVRDALPEAYRIYERHSMTR